MAQTGPNKMQPDSLATIVSTLNAELHLAFGNLPFKMNNLLLAI